MRYMLNLTRRGILTHPCQLLKHTCLLHNFPHPENSNSDPLGLRQASRNWFFLKR